MSAGESLRHPHDHPRDWSRGARSPHAYEDDTFRVGDAFTIEPGLYIAERLLDMLPDTPKNRAFVAKVRPVVKRYENTGVRIEDSYVITPRGLERISLVPREIDEIEALTRRKPVP
ncbi:MAG: M24 family metallopeptidase [Gemmatimonadales bacterium]